EKHLGIEASVDGTGANFAWRDAQRPETKGQVQPIPVKPRGKVCESPEERAQSSLHRIAMDVAYRSPGAELANLVSVTMDQRIIAARGESNANCQRGERRKGSNGT